MLNVISPCVTFNNNEGSTKSYDYVREHMEATATVDFVPLQREITTHYEAGSIKDLLMHDGSVIRLHKLEKDWDPQDRFSAMSAIHHAKQRGEILTGLLYINENASDLHKMLNTSERPLNALGQSDLCPGSEALAALNASLR
jgi:2-oxoglutarate ferredoxin oxidoreductase subunit beta